MYVKRIHFIGHVQETIEIGLQKEAPNLNDLADQLKMLLACVADFEGEIPDVPRHCPECGWSSPR